MTQNLATRRSGLSEADRLALIIMLSIFVGLLFGLSGCATEIPIKIDTSNWPAFQASLQQFTAADLDQATADAQAHGDIIGAGCWPVVKKYVLQGLPDLNIPDGLASKIQRARDLKTQVSGGIPPDLKQACAALVQDMMTAPIIPNAGGFGGGLLERQHAIHGWQPVWLRR